MLVTSLIKIGVILFGLFYLTAWANQDATRCYISDVTDGDTVTKEVIRYKDGLVMSVERVKVRLADIDAPESDQPSGAWSTQQLERMCKHKYIWMQSHGVGHYGRDIDTLYDNTTNINLRMVEIGAAHPLDKKYYSAARNAITKKLGLWQSTQVIHPKSWRDGSKEKNPHKYYLKLYS